MKKNKPSERKFKKPYGVADKLLKRLELEEDPSTAPLREALEKFIPKRDASSWWWWQKHTDLLVRRITNLKEQLEPGWKEKSTNKETKTRSAIQQWLNIAPSGMALIQNFMEALQDCEGLKYNNGPTYLAISIFKFQTGIADEKLETVLQFFNRAKRKYRNGQTKVSQVHPEEK